MPKTKKAQTARPAKPASLRSKIFGFGNFQAKVEADLRKKKGKKK